MELLDSKGSKKDGASGFRMQRFYVRIVPQYFFNRPKKRSRILVESGIRIGAALVGCAAGDGNDGDARARCSNSSGQALAIPGEEGMTENDGVEVTVFEQIDCFFNRGGRYNGTASRAQNKLPRV